MRIVPLGERAWIIADLEVAPWRAADRLRNTSVPGLVDAAAAYETVGVYFESSPGATQKECIEEALATLASETIEAKPAIEVPVCYELGDDIEEVSSMLGLSLKQIAEQHSSPEYECFAVGFQPGFPYLGYLPDSLAGLPRLGSPRPRVEAGSVGITGRQTGIYPGGSPGGWRLIGRTPLCIADLQNGFFLFSAGCRVRFLPIDRRQYESMRGGRHPGTIEGCPP